MSEINARQLVESLENKFNICNGFLKYHLSTSCNLLKRANPLLYPPIFIPSVFSVIKEGWEGGGGNHSLHLLFEISSVKI